MNRIDKIKDLVNKIFMLTGNKKNDDLAYTYAEELNELGITIIPKQLKEFVIKNHKAYTYPPLLLFLNALNYKSKDDLINDRVKLAWNEISELLPYMKTTTTYMSNDIHTLYAIDKIGIDYITQNQEFVSMSINKINSYRINDIKKMFFDYYKYSIENQQNIKYKKQIGNNSNKKYIKIPIETDKTPSNLLENKKNVKYITE